jgi:hypothetical protein
LVLRTPVSSKSVVIVGHGPSLKGACQGPKIDAFDCVVRLKNCYMLLAEYADYGRKTDVMCSSTEVLPTIAKVKAKEYWCYPKKGDYNLAGVQQLERKVAGRIRVPQKVSIFWNAAFVELGGKHPNVSTGMAAIIFALEFRKPEVLTLAGFDKVLNPKIEGYESTVPTEFNDGGKKDTGHDWLKERELLGYLATHYQARIVDIAGRHDIQPGGIPEVRLEVSRGAEETLPR